MDNSHSENRPSEPTRDSSLEPASSNPQSLPTGGKDDRTNQGPPSPSPEGTTPVAPTSGSDPSPGGNHYTFQDVIRNTPEPSCLWSQWIPKGHLTMLVSVPGVGKSFMAMEICRSVTTGADFINGQPIAPNNQGKALWLEAEGMHRMNAERAKSLGIPMDKMIVLSSGAIGRDISLDNQQHLEEIRDLAQDKEIKLFVLDSFSAAFNGHESSADARYFIQEISRIAQDHQKAILIIHHLTKGGRKNHIVEDLSRVRGHSAIRQFVRAVIALDTPNQHMPIIRMRHIKNTLTAFPDPIGLTLKNGIPELVDLPEAEHLSRVEEATLELRNLLEDGQKPSTEVLDAMSATGFSERTVRRASKDLGIIKKKGSGTNGAWCWSLPPGMVPAEATEVEAGQEKPPLQEATQDKPVVPQRQPSIPEERTSNMYAHAKTWNPQQGCGYDCSYCKASFQRQAKRHGHWCADCGDFKPHFHLDRLGKIPSSEIVFVSGMGDISFCKPADFRLILAEIRKKSSRRRKNKPEQTFYFQSKRPAFFTPFLGELPQNAILLTTLETNRDEGYDQISRAPGPSERYRQFLELDYPRKGVTIEPMMDFDHDVFLDWIRWINPEYVYLGFNSKPKAVQLPEPTQEKVLNFLAALEQHGLKVLRKDLRNLRKAG